jgi:uncharacterized damage-inducible protein DinB
VGFQLCLEIKILKTMITFIESFIKELEQESVGTRKILALVPADKMDWAPHPKSMKMKALATHVADIPTWITGTLKSNVWDFSVTPYSPQNCDNAEELVAYFDKNVAEAKEMLSKSKDDILEEIWTLRNGEEIWMQMPKLESIRHAYCQMVHHRAQLGVYLRLLNIPIPGVYGPSADDMGM